MSKEQRGFTPQIEKWEIKGDGRQVFNEHGLVADCAAQWHDDDDEEGLELDWDRNARYAEFIAKAPAVFNALAALVAQLERVHADKAYQSVWTINQVHAGQYRGPQYTEQLEAAKKVLEGHEGKSVEQR